MALSIPFFLERFNHFKHILGNKLQIESYSLKFSSHDDLETEKEIQFIRIPYSQIPGRSSFAVLSIKSTGIS